MAATDRLADIDAHRSRLLEAVALAVARKGYADTTIADIVREAGVSRRTFYEHFATKAECFVALYEAASRNALGVLRDAIDPAQEWQTQVERALAAYLANMASNPVLMRSLYIEILGLGAQGLAARRRANEEIVDFILEVVNGKRARRRESPLTREMATAVLGGINELVLQAIEQDRVDRLVELAGPASQLVRAVTAAGA
jgi:AcrR family transcriptional regulator